MGKNHTKYIILFNGLNKNRQKFVNSLNNMYLCRQF